MSRFEHLPARIVLLGSLGQEQSFRQIISKQLFSSSLTQKLVAFSMHFPSNLFFWNFLISKPKIQEAIFKSFLPDIYFSFTHNHINVSNANGRCRGALNLGLIGELTWPMAGIISLFHSFATSFRYELFPKFEVYCICKVYCLIFAIDFLRLTTFSITYYYISITITYQCSRCFFQKQINLASLKFKCIQKLVISRKFIPKFHWFTNENFPQQTTSTAVAVPRNGFKYFHKLLNE